MAEWTNAIGLGPIHHKDVRRFESCSQHLRFAIQPSYFAHLGHVRTLLAIKNYNSKVPINLRFDDTSQKASKPEYTRSFINLFRQYDVNLGSIIYASKRSSIYYKYLKLLKSKGLVYACSCDPNIDNAYRLKNCDCAASNFWVLDNTKTIRFKTTLTNDIDYVIYRPVNRVKGYMPTLVFQNAVDDLTMNTSTIIRGRDLQSSARRTKEIWAAITNKPFPKEIYRGKISLYRNDAPTQDLRLSKSLRASPHKIPALNALKKCGVRAHHIIKFFNAYGYSHRDLKCDLGRLVGRVK